MHRIRAWAATAIVLVVGHSVLADENWPQFLGPKGTNNSEATDLPASWSETENIASREWRSA